MLVSIVLFLALVSLGFTLVKLSAAIYLLDERLKLDHTFIAFCVTAALFSLFYYLTH